MTQPTKGASAPPCLPAAVPQRHTNSEAAAAIGSAASIDSRPNDRED